MKEVISQVEFAKRNNISQPAVHKLIKSGKLPLKDGKIVMPDAQYAYDEIKKQNSGITENTEKAITASNSITAAKAFHQTYAAKIKKLEYEKLNGSLISIDDVIKEVQNIATVMRAELFAIPAKVAPECEGKSISQIETIIHNAINESFISLNNFDYDQFSPVVLESN